MKFTKKCKNTKLNQKSIKNKRRSSAGLFNTSSAGAVTSLILMLAFGFAGANQVYATTSTLTISITDSVALDITPVSNDGTFATSDTSANNVSVKTNNGTGYTLGIKASVDNNNTLSTTGGASIPSHTITAGVSESNYQDDTYAETNNLNNTWGYRPSKLNSVSNSNYLPGPSSASTVIELDKTNVANASTFNNYNLAIGARVDTATAPGEYSNVFVFTVVANPAVYSIAYNQNTSDTVSDMPSNVTNQETGDEIVTISSTTPSRSGYSFQGWCTTAVEDGADCTGTSYTAGGNWTIDQTQASNSLTLYARWKVSANPYCTDASTCMQNTSVACGTTMTDGRDGNTYTTATIGGACWMTQNLRFNGTELKVGESNVTSNITISQYYSLASADSSYTNHCDSTNGYNYPCIKTSTNTDYGTYYNYCAASANEVCNNSTQADATRSVCPAGWTLPTQAQLNAVPSKSSYFTASSGLAGYYYGGSLYSAGADGYWWASTANSATHQYNLDYNSVSGYWGVSSRYKYRGNSVRCVRSS